MLSVCPPTVSLLEETFWLFLEDFLNVLVQYDRLWVLLEQHIVQLLRLNMIVFDWFDTSVVLVQKVKDLFVIFFEDLLCSSLGASQKVFLDLCQSCLYPVFHRYVLHPESLHLLSLHLLSHLLNLGKYVFWLFLASGVEVEAAAFQSS